MTILFIFEITRSQHVGFQEGVLLHEAEANRARILHGTSGSRRFPPSRLGTKVSCSTS